MDGAQVELLAAALIAVVVVLVLVNLATSEKKVAYRLEHCYAPGDADFAREMGTLLGPALLDGNQVDALYNGKQIFPAMLEAITAAQSTITFETYISWAGDIGMRFAESLADRARAGVKVHVLMDAIGAGKADAAALQLMKDAGVELEYFRPVRWYTVGKLNNRTHRKLLVVDGRVGFTGGVGIADCWTGNAEDEEHWRDSHFRLQGPSVGQMQAAFVDHWITTTARVLHGPDYFPPLEPAGTHVTQVFRSAVNDGAESVRLMYLLSLTAAARRICIANAYFVPDDLTVETLVAARRRGVEVDIIVPGRHGDSVVVRRASRGRWGSLLEAGVRIHEYQPTMYHCKVMVVDDCWTSVGSTNFDSRSFRLNDEANLNVLDRDFARGEVAQFGRDLERSREVTLEKWRRRPLRDKVLDRLATGLRSQL